MSSTHFVFLVDTSPSMLGATAPAGIALLDCAKSAIEHFVKVRCAALSGSVGRMPRCRVLRVAPCVALQRHLCLTAADAGACAQCRIRDIRAAHDRFALFTFAAGAGLQALAIDNASLPEFLHAVKSLRAFDPPGLQPALAASLQWIRRQRVAPEGPRVPGNMTPAVVIVLTDSAGTSDVSGTALTQHHWS